MPEVKPNGRAVQYHCRERFIINRPHYIIVAIRREDSILTRGVRRNDVAPCWPGFV